MIQELINKNEMSEPTNIDDPMAMSLDKQETPWPRHREKQVSKNGEDVEDKPFQTPHILRRDNLKEKFVGIFEGDTEAEDSSGGEEERYKNLKREARRSNKATNKMHLQIKACYRCLIGQLT